MALAVPTKFGQDMVISSHKEKGLRWQSLDHESNIWFDGRFDVPSGKYIEGNDKNVGKTLEKMFQYILTIHPNFFSDKNSTLIKTHLDFPRNWGLGSSSTMIYNLAEWANVDAYLLLENSMGGSGYDIACAGAEHPIIYQIQFKTPFTRNAYFDPPFKDKLYFIYLGKKQNSRSGIKYYRENVQDNQKAISNISIITNRMINATTLGEFQSLVKHHEKMMSSLLNIPRVKKERFDDYWGQVKSLGAWGGDFVMATSKKSRDKTEQYFKEKGYDVFFSYNELII